MKKKILYCVLMAEALLCLGFVVMPSLSLGSFAGAMAFPFEQIGFALRALSLSGTVGNMAAIILYAALCLLPLAVFIFRKPRKLYPEDALVGLLSLTLFWVLYQMINPGTIAIGGGFDQGLPVAKAVLGGTVYSMLVGYLVLRLLRLFCTKETERVQRYLYGLLFLLNMLFVAVICGGGVSELLASFASMESQNSGNGHLFGINSFFIVLRVVADYLPYALNIGIVFAAMSFLQNAQQDWYSQNTIAAAQRLWKVCAVSLAVVVVSPIAFNVSQLLFARRLFAVNSTLQIPLFSILFVLACLLFARLVTQSKALKDDNDSII